MHGTYRVNWKRPKWPELTKPGPNGEQALMSVKEFAKLCQVTERTVRIWITSRRLIGIKRGGKWWVYPPHPTALKILGFKKNS